jgi:HSP20 family protein
MAVKVKKGEGKARGAEKRTATAALEESMADSSAYPLQALRNQVDRLFEHYFREFGPPFRWRGAGYGPFGVLETEFGSRGEFLPRADVVETNGHFVISVELPGMDQDEIEVSMVDNELIIDGEKARKGVAEAAVVRLGERRYGRVHRTFRIPENADADQITASFDHGVLAIVLPKRADAAEKPVKRVEVTLG